MIFSFIIAHLNNECELYYTLWDLFKEVDGFDYEIIIVDNGSEDTSYLKAKKYVEKMVDNHDIKLFKYTEFQGTVPPWQFGAEKAIGKYLVFIDSHVTTCTGYFKKQYEILKDDTIKVLWSASCFNGYIGDKSNYYYLNKEILSLAFANYCDETEPLVSQMGCVIVEREFFIKIGMFGKCFLKYGGYGAEELMLSLKTKMFGGRTVFNKDVFFHHSILDKAGGKKLKLQNKAIAAYILDGYDYMLEVIKGQPEDVITLLTEEGRQELTREIPRLAREDRNLLLTAPISYRELLKKYYG
jgi:glycosyltransferase involved in cell wall biosynthesis